MSRECWVVVGIEIRGGQVTRHRVAVADNLTDRIVMQSRFENEEDWDTVIVEPVRVNVK